MLSARVSRFLGFFQTFLTFNLYLLNSWLLNSFFLIADYWSIVLGFLFEFLLFLSLFHWISLLFEGNFFWWYGLGWCFLIHVLAFLFCSLYAGLLGWSVFLLESCLILWEFWLLVGWSRFFLGCFGLLQPRVFLDFLAAHTGSRFFFWITFFLGFYIHMLFDFFQDCCC